MRPIIPPLALLFGSWATTTATTELAPATGDWFDATSTCSTSRSQSFGWSMHQAGSNGCSGGGWFYWCGGGCTGSASITLPAGYSLFTVEYGNSCRYGDTYITLDGVELHRIPQSCGSQACYEYPPTYSCTATFTASYTGTPTLTLAETGTSIMWVARVLVGHAGANGDPHLSLPHGGKADFRGEHKTLYNFLSAKNMALNVMTEMADFELHPDNHTRHKDVHGSFLTQAHIVARTNTSKVVRVSFWADMIAQTQNSAGLPMNLAWANGTVSEFGVDGDVTSPFVLTRKHQKQVDDVLIRTDYSSLHVITPEFEIVVTPQNFRLERNVVGLHHRLDIKILRRVAEAAFAVPPHGIIGQGWDGDGQAIDGEQDAWPVAGEFTTYAMAKGAIEGVPSDYKVTEPYATDFKYSRFDATSARPRNVAKLVATGELNAPKTVDGGETVGSTDDIEAKM